MLGGSQEQRPSRDAASQLQDDIQKANQAWRDDEVQSIRAAADQRARGQHDPEGIASAMQFLQPDEAVPRLHAAMGKFLQKHAPRFKAVWKGMEQAVRVRLLRILSADSLPRFRGDKNSGGPGQSRGVAVLCPDLNLEELSHPETGVPRLMEQICGTPLRELYWQDAQYLRPLWAGGQLRAQHIRPNAFCMVHDEGPKMLSITRKADKEFYAHLQTWIEAGMAYEGLLPYPRFSSWTASTPGAGVFRLQGGLHSNSEAPSSRTMAATKR